MLAKELGSGNSLSRRLDMLDLPFNKLSSSESSSKSVSGWLEEQIEESGEFGAEDANDDAPLLDDEELGSERVDPDETDDDDDDVDDNECTDMAS